MSSLRSTADIKHDILDEASKAELEWDNLKGNKQAESDVRVIEVGELFEEMTATKGWERILNFMSNIMKVENLISTLGSDNEDKLIKEQLYYVKGYKRLLHHVYGVMNRRKEILKAKGGE